MIWITPILVFVLTCAGTKIIRLLALRHGMLDMPNVRGSHFVPTPRGGGVVIALCSIGGIAVLSLWGAPLGRSAWVATLGSGAVAAIGLIDDRVGLSAIPRLAVHLVVSAWLIASLGGLPPQPVGSQIVDFGLVGSILTILAAAWFVNLFNFMDGIDGIAASEAAFIALAGILVLWHVDAPGPALAVLGCIAGASLGFLVWNWAPARIFMGDAGSYFLGFALVVCALWSCVAYRVPIWTWIIFGAPFIADATVTLVRRVARGDRWYSAHRSHAYQRLARARGSHAWVVKALIVLNLLVLLPVGLVAAAYPQWSLGLAVTMLVAAGVAAFKLGAGRPE